MLTLSTVLYSVCTLYRFAYNVSAKHCTLCIVQYHVQICLQCAQYTVQICLQCAQYTVQICLQCSQYTVQICLHCAQYTVQICLQCTFSLWPAKPAQSAAYYPQCISTMYYYLHTAYTLMHCQKIFSFYIIKYHKLARKCGQSSIIIWHTVLFSTYFSNSADCLPTKVQQCREQRPET